MATLLMLKGLPASGKSTYAKELANKGWQRSNKDDLRDMIHNGKWSRGNEKFIIKMRDMVVTEALIAGKNVVVDDTNFAPVHEVRLRQLADAYGAEFEVKFFDTPLEECIKRDLARPVSVGEAVIRSFYRDFLAPKQEKPVIQKGLPWAILCDIDGTLAHMSGRSPYEWKRVGEDTLDEEVADVLDSMQRRNGIILMSGRDGSCRPETEEWLKQNNIYYDALFMREAGDSRKDNVVKEEIYEREIVGNFNVRFVLDDRNQVVEMWRRKGLKCFQVAPGDF